MLKSGKSKTVALALLALTISLLFTTTTLFTLHTAAGVTFSPGVSITPSGPIDGKPYVAEDARGVLWLAYESSRSGNWDIYVKTYNGVSWSSDSRMTSSVAADLTPGVVPLSNGTVTLVWSSDRVLAGNYSLYLKTYNTGVWSADYRLTTGPLGSRDSGPSLLQLQNGTIWVFFTREIVSGQTVSRYVYYKTYNNGGWSIDRQFTTGGSELQLNLLQADNGTIFVLYTAIRSDNQDLYYKKLTAGAWSAETALTSNVNDDRQGWLMQDFNGQLWVFWNRCLPSGGGNCQDDIFYKTSTNLGASWSAETQFTVDPATYEVFDTHPAAVQGPDKRVHLFWGTDLTGPNTDFDIYESTSDRMPIHDVGIVGAKAGPTSLMVGGLVKVNVTVANFGDYTETVRLYGYYANSSTYTWYSQTFILAPNASSAFQLTWNTTGVEPASSPGVYYDCLVYVQPVAGESVRRQYDNTVNAGSIAVLPNPVPGDVDRNGRVNLFDASRLVLALDSIAGDPRWNPMADINGDRLIDIVDVVKITTAWNSVPGMPNWNPNADINKDNKVDISDLVVVTGAFSSYPPSPNWNPNADLNHDGRVNIFDLVIVSVWYDTST